ncbi:hypothetical protein [Sphingomonas sp. ERG5]|uniref:hypothetical protein n=1 Tax=Sphingomonas sp. ERG5 TaxID=1381597 RepID=UPI00054BAED2|nr:hypothetical protein [Sphingomonas sp. ERG5]
MLWWLAQALLGAIGILWLAGSLIATAMRPWRHFDRDDRWIAWALVIGWPLIAVAMAIELAIEFRLDRRDMRSALREARSLRRRSLEGRDAV